MGSFSMRVVGATQRYPTTSTNAAAASAVVTTSPARLYSISGYNNGAAQYIQLFDLTALPADTTVPLLSFPVGAQQWWYFDWQDGLPMTLGVVVCNSSTALTKTIGAADNQFVATFRTV